MKTFAAGDAATAVTGSAVVAAKTAAVNAVAGTGADMTCTSTVVYKVPKDAKDAVVTAMKTAGIKLGDTGAYATVTATQSTAIFGANNAKNAAGKLADGNDCAGGDAAAKEAACAAGGLSVYTGVVNSGEMFIWGITAKPGAAATTDGAAADKKKSATTLAIGAAAGLVAAAIA